MRVNMTAAPKTTFYSSRSLRRGLVAAPMALALVASGCSTGVGEIGGLNRLTAADTADACGQFRRELVGYEDHFKENLVRSTLGGALIGAVGGAVIGGLAGGSSRSAALGALAGGLAGAAAGYLKAKAENADDKTELRNSIYQDASADSSQLNDFAPAITRLNSCRSTQIAEVRGDFEAGNIDKEVAQQRLSTIRAAIARDSELIAGVLDDARERRGIYAESVAAVDEVDQEIVLSSQRTYKPKLASRPAPAAKPATTSPTPSARPAAQPIELPVVQASARPNADNAVQGFDYQIEEVSAQTDAQSAALDAQTEEALDVILS